MMNQLYFCALYLWVKMSSPKEVHLRYFNVHKFVGQIGIQGVTQQMNSATCVHKASKP